MQRHRFLEQMNRESASPVSAPATGAFIVCPMVLVQGGGGGFGVWQQQLYQLAFQQAQASVQQPSLWKRALAPSLN
jgi:hypothetical protein